MKTLQQKIAEQIDRACQFDDYSGSIFKDNNLEAEPIKKYYLKIADQIIKIVRKGSNYEN
jgi:hypothetical protein